jgi:hypothetical protein
VTTKSVDQAVEYIVVAIAEKISEIFMMPLEEVDLTNEPAYHGLDSLVVVKLRNMLATTGVAKSAYISK